MSFNCFIILKCSKLVIVLNCLFYLSTNLILNFMHDITWNDLIYKLVCRGWFCMKYYVIVSRCWLFHCQYFNTRSNSSEAETSFKSNVYCFKAGKKRWNKEAKCSTLMKKLVIMKTKLKYLWSCFWNMK